MALAVVESLTRREGSETIITVTSDAKVASEAIEELRSPFARKLAIEYASMQCGISKPCHGLVVHPFPVSDDGKLIEGVGEGAKPVKVARYLVEIPVRAGL